MEEQKTTPPMVKVDFPAGRNSLHRAGEVKLHVCNLPYSTSHAQIGALFARYGEVLEAFVLKRPHPLNNFRSAIVRMAPAMAAETAMQELNGVMWRGNILRVQRSKHDAPLMGLSPDGRTGSEVDFTPPLKFTATPPTAAHPHLSGNPYEAMQYYQQQPGPIRKQASPSRQRIGVVDTSASTSVLPARYAPYPATVAKPASGQVCFSDSLTTSQPQHEPAVSEAVHQNGFWQPQSIANPPRANFVNPFQRMPNSNKDIPHNGHPHGGPTPPHCYRHPPFMTPHGMPDALGPVTMHQPMPHSGDNLQGRQRKSKKRTQPQGSRTQLRSTDAMEADSSPDSTSPTPSPSPSIQQPNHEAIPLSPLFVHQPYATPMEWD